MSNLASRLLVAAVAIPLLLLVVYLGGVYFLVLTLGIGLLAFHEIVTMSREKGTSVNLVAGMLAIAALHLNFYFELLPPLQLFIFITAVTAVWELWRNLEEPLHNISVTFFGIMYVGLFSGTLIPLRAFPANDLHGAYLIGALFVTIWVMDSAAYFGGVQFGKHKLFERVSPKKTWEGAFFGVLGAFGTMALLKVLLLDFFSWQDVIIISAIISAAGQIGDLAESLIKRDVQIKDSSSLIPGHGGVFDRFDSLLLVAPLVYVYLLIV